MNLPADYTLKSNAKLVVNGYLITPADYTYSKVDKFLYIKRLESQCRPVAHTLAKAPTENVYTEYPSLHGVKIAVDDEEYELNKSGKLSIEIPSEEGLKVNAFKLVEKNGKQFIKVDLQSTKATDETSQLEKKTYTGVDEFDENIHDFRNEILSQKRQRIRINEEIRNITKQLSDNPNLDSIKRVGLQRYLTHLESLLYESDLAYRSAKEDTETLLQEIQTVLSEKDSIMEVRLDELIDAEKNTEEARKRQEQAEQERDNIYNRLMIMISIMVFAILLTILIYRDRQKIKKQKGELESLNDELVVRNDEIEKLNDEMAYKNVQLEQNMKRWRLRHKI